MQFRLAVLVFFLPLITLATESIQCPPNLSGPLFEPPYFGFSPEAIEVINDKYQANVRPILIANCAHCHATQEELPFYADYPIIEKLIQSDVAGAQMMMKISRSYPLPNDKTVNPISFLYSLRSVLLGNTMPPTQFVVVHWTTSLSANEKLILLDWADRGIMRLRLEDQIIFANLNPAQKTQRLFQERCARCHIPTPGHPEYFSTIGNLCATEALGDKYINRKDPEKGLVFIKVHSNEMPYSPHDKLDPAESQIILDELKNGAPLE